MSKKEKEHAVSIQDTNSILKTISFQLERLIRIQEKRLSGEIIKILIQKRRWLMLRTLLQKKENLRGLMATLWEKEKKAEVGLRKKKKVMTNIQLKLKNLMKILS